MCRLYSRLIQSVILNGRLTGDVGVRGRALRSRDAQESIATRVKSVGHSLTVRLRHLRDMALGCR